MEDRTLDGVKPEEISESFICCVCLDLLYKPIVLCCGHVSCFWCVHKSMSGMRESHCPICRHPYNHFPTICQMLHFLLQKMYPIAYKARELQVLEEEKENDWFSPQLGACAYISETDKDLENRARRDQFCAPTKQLDSTLYISNNGTTIPERAPDGNLEVTEIAPDGNLEVTEIASDAEKNFPQNQHDRNCKQISVEDVLCAACKRLLFCPVVLNCGHVYCKSCTWDIADEMLKCQVCQSPHPKGLPKVCLELDNFLKAQFPKEYALRRDAVKFKQVNSNHERQTTSSTEGDKQADILGWWSDPHSKVHMHAGCDSCGMYPIIGDRYRCTDCVEKIGFDLCGDCYNTRSKLPGRFNQQHTPEHKFEHVPSNIIRNIMLRLVTGQIDDSSTLFITSDASESLEDLSTPPPLSGVAEESVENGPAIPATSGDGAEDQDDSEDTTLLN